MNLGPYPTARECRTALVEAGYTTSSTRPGRPQRWVHPPSGKEKAVRMTRDKKAWVIVEYPQVFTTKMKVIHGA